MENLTFKHHILLVEGLKVTDQSAYPAFILLFLAYVFIMISNIGLIMIISMEESLHQPMHILFCNLPVNDALGTTVIVPRLLNDIFRETSDRYITYVECVIQAYFAHLFATTSHVGILLGLTVRLSHCRSTILNPFCDNVSLYKLSCEDVLINNVYGLVFTFIGAVFAIGGIAFSYLKIALVCLKSKSKVLNTRALKTCCTHLSLYIILLVSGFTVVFLHRLPQYSDERKLSSIMFHVVPPSLNPIIYGLQTKEIRQKFTHLFCRNKVTV
ncbi:olfactory receptor 146-like [Chanos chanos]|uniref:Olfactory receptor 146-like n=1 Tax=Chanos chanos TaxID=29144 RepID=A0A6J2WYA1_CHACN|nr:olfactory receptor 146-like [Chanos chanos]